MKQCQTNIYNKITRFISFEKQFFLHHANT